MRALSLVLLSAICLSSCGKKAEFSPQNITMVMTAADQSLSLAQAADATMGVAGCHSGLNEKKTGAIRQEFQLPEGEAGCYGYLASFSFDGHDYRSDDMSPKAFTQGGAIHFFSREAGKLFKVTIASQLGLGDNNGRTVNFQLSKARYLEFFPYNHLPVQKIGRLGTETDALPLRLDRLRYRGLTANGTPKFKLEVSCESVAATAKEPANSCLRIATDKIRLAVVSSNEAHGNLEQLKALWGQITPSGLPAQPTKVIGRRLLYAKADFAAEGRKSRLVGSKDYLLVIAYNGSYYLHRFPLPTISYTMQPGGKHTRR